MDGSIGFSTTQSIRNYPETSFTFQNKFYKNFGTAHKFKKKWNFMNLKKKKAKWIGYLEVISDTHFISLQYEPSPILVSPKLGDPCSFQCQKPYFLGEQL